MKNIFMSLLLTVGLFGVAPSCTITTADGQGVSLEEATDEQFEAVRARVYNTSLATGGLLKIGLAEKPQVRADIARLANDLSEQVEKGNVEGLRSGDVVNFLLKQFGQQLSLSPKDAAIIGGIASVVDAATGGIDVGIEGVLTDRESQLMQAMLDGLAQGVA